jgi:hypothetical protein
MRPADHWTRRRLCLAAAGAAGALAARRHAAAQPGPWGPEEPPLTIDIPQLRYPGQWNPRPGALRELGVELRLRTRLEPRHEPSVVDAEDSALFSTPFLYVAGRGGLPELGSRAEAQLRRFVDLGGMLVFDDADGGADAGFFRDVRVRLERILPGSLLAPIAPDHVLFRSFYILERPTGRTVARDEALGIQEEGRLKVLVFPNDLGGALVRDADGVHVHPCEPGGATQRELAIRFGVNLLLYATCTDYKSDRAHVETLLRSRRWR